MVKENTNHKMRDPKPGGHYTKWKKPDTEGQILYDLTYMWNQKSQIHGTRE